MLEDINPTDDELRESQQRVRVPKREARIGEGRGRTGKALGSWLGAAATAGLSTVTAGLTAGVTTGMAGVAGLGGTAGGDGGGDGGGGGGGGDGGGSSGGGGGGGEGGGMVAENGDAGSYGGPGGGYEQQNGYGERKDGFRGQGCGAPGHLSNGVQTARRGGDGGRRKGGDQANGVAGSLAANVDVHEGGAADGRRDVGESRLETLGLGLEGVGLGPRSSVDAAAAAAVVAPPAVGGLPSTSASGRGRRDLGHEQVDTQHMEEIEVQVRCAGSRCLVSPSFLCK